jgi:tetratricopeptide (TPR) repeat protein
MRFYTLLIFIALLKLSVSSSLAQTITLTSPPNGNNQKSSVTQWIGLVSVTITYNGPDVHSPTGEDRKGHIWGELVHYGLKDPDGYGTSLASPWRAGSNEITTISVSHDVKINGKDLKAGTYGLMLLLDKDEPWTWIFSKNSTSWGVYYYTADEDVLRVETTPEDCAYTEWLTYGFDDRQLISANAYLQWENKKIPFKVEVPNGMQLYVDKMRAELTSFAGFNYANWWKNARFCLSNKINLDEALKWVNISMNTDRFNGQKSFGAMQTKADILTLLNRSNEAETVMKEALNMDATVIELHQYGRSLLEAGKSEQALEIFKLNRKRHMDDKFTTFVGLARGYTAVGHKKEAIKNWEMALKNIPENQKSNTSAFEEELKKLKQ